MSWKRSKPLAFQQSLAFRQAPVQGYGGAHTAVTTAVTPRLHRGYLGRGMSIHTETQFQPRVWRPGLESKHAHVFAWGHYLPTHWSRFGYMKIWTEKCPWTQRKDQEVCLANRALVLPNHLGMFCLLRGTKCSTLDGTMQQKVSQCYGHPPKPRLHRGYTAVSPRFTGLLLKDAL